MRSISSLVYPKMCIGCMERSLGSDQGNFCIYCLSEMPHTDHFANPKQNALCERLYGRLPIEFAGALYYFSEGNIIQNMMHAFKYRGETYVGTKLGEILGKRILESKVELPDCIVPVPMDKAKMLARGFNQSAVIARALSTELGKEFSENYLIKIMATDSQTSKNKMERMDNLKNAFSLTEKGIKRINGKHILLVDDTVTTGATVEACGRIMLQHGANKISVACAALAI